MATKKKTTTKTRKKLRDDQRMAIAFAMRQASPPRANSPVERVKAMWKATAELELVVCCMTMFGWSKKRTLVALNEMLRRSAKAKAKKR